MDQLKAIDLELYWGVQNYARKHKEEVHQVLPPRTVRIQREVAELSQTERRKIWRLQRNLERHGAN